MPTHRDRCSSRRHSPAMKTSLGLLALLLLPFVPACEEKDEKEAPQPLTIVDKSAEEAADITTEAACDYVSRCGRIEITCADCVDGEDCGGCYVEQIEVTVEDCESEIAEDVVAGFSCQPLTAEEETLVDECLAALDTAECPSVEQVESWASGEGGEDPRPGALAACDVIDEIMSRCYDDGDEPPPAEPMEG